MRAIYVFFLSFFVLSNISFGVNLAEQQVVHLGNGAEPKELDPAKATGAPEGNILDTIFEGLTNLHPFSLESTPGVAESWQVSKDGLTYTFKIRTNAKWSDGKAITAEDFVWSWTRALAPATASEYAYQLYYIKNGEAFNSGKIKDPKQLGVIAKDNHTLVVTLEAPTPFFLQLTAFRTLYPTPKHIVTKFPNQEWTKEGKIVTNGPFRLSEWRLNQHIKVEPNPHYWNRDAIKVETAFFYPIENLDTEERSFLSGQLHSTNDIPNLKIPSFKKEKADNPNTYHPFRADPYLGIYYYRFNVTKKPMNDVRVRKALSLAIDRSVITERVTKAGEVPATTFTPPNTAGYTSPDVLPRKLTPEVLAEARKLLADAGYPGGKGFPKIDILYNTQENHKKIALVIQQMWKKNLGIEVGLFNQEWKVYLDSQRKLNYQVSRSGWIGDYADPNTFLDMWLTGGGQNQTGWSNKTYDKLIADAANTYDRTKRYQLFLQAEKILMEEMPVMPIYVYVRKRLLSEKLRMIDPDSGRVVDWKPNIQDRLFLANYVLAK